MKKRFRSGVNIHRTRSFPGADIGSDHDLVMMTFQVRLKKTRKPNQPRLRFDLEKLRPSLKFCQFAVLRPTRQNRRDPTFFIAISDFLFFFRGFRALRSYAENRHQRRPRTSKIISVCPYSKAMSYIPITFRMINSCQNKYIKCIS